MSDKIIVEFDRENLEKVCYDEDDPESWRCYMFKRCKRNITNLLKCLMCRSIKFKIKDKYKIETKFKENDLIWLIDYDSENGIWFVSGSFYIWKILIQVVSGNIDIQYGLLKDNNYYWYMKEQNCFLTKEEAQKECERRNNGK